MKVSDVMTRDVVTVGPDAPFRDIVEVLLARGISGVPVVDEDGSLLGVVTEADLATKVAYPRRERAGIVAMLADRLSGRAEQIEKAHGLTASEIMNAPVVTALPDEHVSTAARRMLDRDVKRLPVVRDGRVVGIVARRDLLPIFTRSDHSLEAEVRDLLRHALFVPPEHDVDVNVVDGVATLSGRVYFRSDRRIIEAIVSALPGLIGVENHLEHRFEDVRRAT